MAAYFFDSSALVKRYAVETGTVWMLGLFRRAAGHRLYVARITGVEVTAALTRKARGHKLAPDVAARALVRLRRELGRRLRLAEITPALLTDAMTLAEKHGLRGYDAVQLASAVEANNERVRVGLAPLVFVAADSDLLAAAVAEGFITENPNNH